MEVADTNLSSTLKTAVMRLICTQSESTYFPSALTSMLLLSAVSSVELIARGDMIGRFATSEAEANGDNVGKLTKVWTS